MPESKTSSRRIKAALKQVEALDLRMNDWTYQAIANKLGYGTRHGAMQAVKAILAKTLQAPADEWRAFTTERLTKIIHTFWPGMIAKDEKAAGVVLRAIAELRQLLGLDAPVQHEVSGPGGGPVAIDYGIRSALVDKMTDEEVDRAIAEAQAIVKGR